jgi:hypothetical protein
MITVNERLQRLMIAHGALVFLIGMAAGFPFGFAILAEAAPDAAAWQPPGDVRGWRMAHLEGVLNGLTLIAVAAVADKLRLSATLCAVVAWGLIITSWGNMIASIIGPVFGGRGLEFGGGVSNSLMFVLFMIAVLTVIASMAIVVKGALSEEKK